MASFSEYGGVAPEWAALMATKPEPNPPPDQSVHELRRLTNNQREEASRRYIQTIGDVACQDFNCEAHDGWRIPLRVYKPKSATAGELLPVYMWYHGGGFLFGTLASEDAFCFTMVRELKAVVVNICYRHTPESQWPVQANDAYTGIQWAFDKLDILGGDSQRIVVAGVSAGALLAAGVALRNREAQRQPQIRGLILDIPVLCHTANFPYELISAGKSSYHENKHAPILPASRMSLFEELLGKNAAKDPEYNLLLKPDEDLKGLPPTHFHIAGRDILRDQAFLFKEKLDRNRTLTSVNVYRGLPHGFRRHRDLKATQQWVEDHVAAAQRLLETS